MNLSLNLPQKLARDLFEGKMIYAKVDGEQNLLSGMLNVLPGDRMDSGHILSVDLKRQKSASGIQMLDQWRVDVTQEMFDKFRVQNDTYYADWSGLILTPRKRV